MKPFTLLESATVKRSYGILTHVTPLGMDGALKGKIVTMVYLVVIIIELSYETSYTAVNDHNSDLMMLYRSRIGDYLVKIAHTCRLGLWAAEVVTLAYEPGGMWCCGARSRSISMI